MCRFVQGSDTMKKFTEYLQTLKSPEIKYECNGRGGTEKLKGSFKNAAIHGKFQLPMELSIPKHSKVNEVKVWLVATNFERECMSVI